MAALQGQGPARQRRRTTSSPSGPSRSSAGVRGRADPGASGHRSARRERARAATTCSSASRCSRRRSPASRTSAQWIYEVKYDGYRIRACKAGDEVRLYTRRGRTTGDRSLRPQHLRRRPSRRCRRARVRGGRRSVRSVDETGKPSFHALQEWLAGDDEARRTSASWRSTCSGWTDGIVRRREPLEARRELLEKLFERQKAPLSFSARRRGGPRAAARHGGEGGGSRGPDGQAQGHAVRRASAARTG